MTILLDYSHARPSSADMRAFGAVGVIRYLTHSRTAKRLGKTEAAQLRKDGFLIGLVFEDTADRTLGGRDLGRADTVYAAQQAAQLGAPPTVPIFFAVDSDLNPARVLPYFLGCLAARTNNPVGVYGSQRVVDALMGAGVPYGWQTVAWSHGHRSAGAHLLQTVERSVPGTDKNLLLRPLPLWGGTVQPPGGPLPAPQPKPAPTTRKETDMRIVYVPKGPTALLTGDAKLVSLTSNEQVDAYKKAGAPVIRVTQDEMDTYAAVSASLK